MSMDGITSSSESVDLENDRSISLTLDDIDHSWLHESDGTWLENWWKSVGTGDLTVKSRLAVKKRTFAKSPRKSPPVEITQVDLFHFTQEELSCTDYFDVILNGPQGLGLNLNVSITGKAVVQSLTRLAGGQPSPAMIAGSIRKGDILIGVNGSDLEKMDLVEVTELIKLVEKTGKNESIRLRFRYGDVVQHSETSWLAQLKPTIIRTDSTDDKIESFLEDPLLGIRSTRHSGGVYVSNHGAGSSRFSGRDLAIGADSVGVFKDQMVDLLLNSDVYGTTIGTQLQLPSTNPLFTRPLVVTAEMLHSQIRSRHRYPTAARVTCNGTSINERLLLQELAEEIFEWRPSYFAHLYSGFFAWKKFSKFIRTPRDKARYKYTQSWDPLTRQYVDVDENSRAAQKELHRQQWLQLSALLRDFQLPLLQLTSELEGLIEIKEFTDISLVLAQELENADHQAEESESDEESTPVVSKRDQSFSIASSGEAADRVDLTLLLQSVIDKLQLSQGKEEGALSATTVAKTSKRISATHSKAANLHSVPNSIAQMQSVSPLTLKKLTNTYHVITSQHDEIRNMLRSEPEAIIAKLLITLDTDYVSYQQFAQQQANRRIDARNRPNVGPVPRHYETGLEVFLPPYDVTYLIFYAFLYKLTPVLLIHPSIPVILTKWMSLFSPDSILKTKDTHSAVRAAPSSATIAYSRYDFLIYYNNNLSSVTNIKGYLEVISDLLTLYFVLRGGRSQLKINNDKAVSAETVGPTAKKKDPSQYCRLNYLPVTLDFAGFHSDRLVDLRSVWSDKEACAFVNFYRELLQIDLAAAVCSARGLFFTLENLLAITTSNESFIDASVLLKELIARTCNNNNQLNYNPVSSAQYIVDRVQGSVHAEFNLMFCLYLKQLGHLFRANDQLAVELSVLFFPWSIPSVVKYNIFGEVHHKTIFVPFHELLEVTKGEELNPVENKKVPPRSQAKHVSKSLDVAWFLSAHCKYHLYLTRILSSLPSAYHRTICKTSSVVDEWLESSLYIDTLQRSLLVIGQTSSVPTASAPILPLGTSSKSHISSAFAVINATHGYYAHDLQHCLQVCAKYKFLEGVSHFTREILYSKCRLSVMLYSELNQFGPTESPLYQKNTPVNGYSDGDRSVLRELELCLLSSLEVSLIKLIEPVVTSQVNCGFSDYDSKQCGTLLNLLWLVLYCFSIEAQFVPNQSRDSADCHVSSTDRQYHALIESLHRIERSKRDKDYSLVVEDIKQHQWIQKRVLVHLLTRLDGVFKSVFRFVETAMGVEPAVRTDENRDRSKSSSSSAGSSMSSSLRSAEGHRTSAAEHSAIVNGALEKEVRRSVATELATIIVQGVGLTFGLVVLSKHPEIKNNLTDSFYSALSAAK